MLKRTADIVLSLVGLLVLLPFLLLVMVLIKLDSEGPVFFRQERVGRDGRGFRIFKFRTMIPGAARMGSRLTVKRDPRITPMGQVLRWFKIDELPQLLNVLVGDMSLIGPRPEDPHFVQFYSDEERRVLSVRPGIVGPSQIYGRDEIESYPEGLKDTEAYYVEHILPDKLARDLEYVDHGNFRGDMLLLGRGLWATVRGAVKGKFLWRRRKRVALLALDGVLIAVAYTFAYLIRVNFHWPISTAFFLPPLIIMMAVRIPALMYFGAQQGVLAYFGLWDLIAIFKAVTLSALMTAGLTFFIGLQAYPRSVFLIDWGLALFLMGGARYVLRGVVRGRSQRSGRQRRCALVVGGGIGGEQIARTLLEDPASHYRPVGFIDEMPERWGALIHGIPVLGGATELPLVLSSRGIRTVFICMADLDEDLARAAVLTCERERVEYRIVPALSDLLGADVFRSNGHALSEPEFMVAREVV